MPDVVPCPLCGKIVPVTLDALPATFPFCSERCKVLDLGRWCDGTYAIPGKESVGNEDSEHP